MSLRDSYSRLKDNIKQRLKGKKRKPDRKGIDSTESFPRPGPQVVGSSGRDRGGDGDNADGRDTHSMDQPVQLFDTEPLFPSGSENDQEGRTANVDQKVTNETQTPISRPDIGFVVESGEAEQVCPPPPVTSAPLSVAPDST